MGKLSDVTKAVQGVAGHMPVELSSFVTVADVNKVKMYMKNFGEFYNDQIEHASTVILSRTGTANEAKVEAAVALLREKNPNATIITTDWAELTGAQIKAAIEAPTDLVHSLLAEAEASLHEEHEHHHHHDEECGCEHHHDHEEHEHHHHHDDECGCGHHHHDHHHHHHADEVFTSWGKQTARKYTKAELEFALAALDDGKFGQVLRAKGILPGTDGGWFHFDYVPGEWEVRTGGADVSGRLCVIGAQLDEPALDALFHI